MISVGDIGRLAVLEVPAIRRSYAEAMMLRARWRARRGQWLRGAEAALRAWRAEGPRFSARNRAWCIELLRTCCYTDGKLAPIASNKLLRDFAQSAEATETRRLFGAFPGEDRARLRYPKAEDDPERQGDLIILKAPNRDTGELGVLLIKYTEAFRRLAAVFDLAELAARYQIVLEPSWWGYQDVTFCLFLGSDLDVVILSQRGEDYDFVESLDSNLVPVRLGAGDWVDPQLFQSTTPWRERQFDVVMVAGWSAAKRHATLFRALRDLRTQSGRVLKVALIGYPQGWTRDRIEALMDRFGVRDQCTVFEAIPQAQVATIVADSRLSVVLSKREGANKALYESLFSDTPVVLIKGQIGVNLEHITNEVGAFTDERSLAKTLASILDGGHRMRPRQWAEEHTGWMRSTRVLNMLLRDLALRRGRPWTVDIEGKKNAPNLRYAREGVFRQFESHYTQLADCLRHDRDSAAG